MVNFPTHRLHNLAFGEVPGYPGKTVISGMNVSDLCPACSTVKRTTRRDDYDKPARRVERLGSQGFQLRIVG